MENPLCHCPADTRSHWYGYLSRMAVVLLNAIDASVRVARPKLFFGMPQSLFDFSRHLLT
jgi:hypothetical protein